MQRDLSQPAPDQEWTMKLADGLTVRATEMADSPLLIDFFAAYDRAFILPDEKEDIDGFRTCLALNRSCRGAFGRTRRELVTTLHDPGGRIIGGANFLAIAMPPMAGHPPIAVALNYLFVDQAARGRGLSRILLGTVSRLAEQAVGNGTCECGPALFIEQNDPLQMSEADYAADTLRSGTDQVERLQLWRHLGARAIDFPYIQPALSDGQEPEDALLYSVIGLDSPSMAAAYLHDHLESFFGISVLKGADPHADPVAGAQLRQLDAMTARQEDIALLDIGPALHALSAERQHWPQAGSLRELAGTLDSQGEPEHDADRR